MSDIEISMNLTDNGSIKSRTKDARELNDELRIQDSITSKLNKAVRAGFKPAPQKDENGEYSTAKGVIGTGAASRDFAKQAQGLGGLVHVYATFAANLFAVGAAFRALSEAADTTNMVKGLDQLGAQSGKNLGTLSKRLVEVTDGAISLKEAMTAVAQSSSAGMTTTNILKLGTVANQVSKALGLSVPDAVSRLSRGISKIEPELLDELGIFVKVDKASEDYARTLGKTASTLTDFEKRQGFANAVLKEANDKFGKISVDANPYDKLLASAKNMSVTGLELVNKVLQPIVNLLATSPVALGAAMAGIATLLVKQAIPAIGQYRYSLAKAAEESLALVSGKSQQAAKNLAAAKLKAQAEADAVAESYATALQKAQDKYESIKSSKLAGSRARVASILAIPDINDISKKDTDYLYKQADRNLKTNKELSDSYREIADSIVGYQQAGKQYSKAQLDATNAQLDAEKRFKPTRKEDADFKAQSQAALSKSIALAAANTVAEQGYFAALKKGWADIKLAKEKGGELTVETGKYKRDDKGKFLRDEDGKKIKETTQVAVQSLGTMGAASATARMAVSATGAALGKFLGFLGGIAPYAAVAGIAFDLLDAKFNSARKYSEELKKSYQVLDSSIENVTKTVDAIAARSPDKIFSIETIQARANAFNDLDESLGNTSKKFDELTKHQNEWSQIVEGTQRLFSKVTLGLTDSLLGEGTRKEMSDNLGKSVIAAIIATESGPARDKISEKMQELLGFDVSTLDTKGLQDKLSKLDYNQLNEKTKDASKLIHKFSTEANNAAAILTSYQDSLKQTEKDIDALSASLTLTDNMGKIGTDLINVSSKMSKVLEDSIKSFTTIKETVNSTQLLAVLPPELSNRLIAAKDEIDQVNASLGQTREATLNAKKELARMKTEGFGWDPFGVRSRSDKKIIAKQEEAVASAEFLQNQVETRAKQIAKQYSFEIANSLFTEGLQRLDAALKHAIQEGAIAAQKGYLNVLAAAGGKTAEAQADLQIQELNIQKQLIDANYAAKLAQEKNTLAIDRNTLESQRRDAQDRYDAFSKAGNTKMAQESNERLTTINKNIDINEAKSKILESGDIIGSVKRIKGLDESKYVATDAEKEAALGMSSLVSTIYGRDAAKAKISGQISAAEADKILKVNKEAADFKNKELDRTIQKNNIEISSIAAQESILGIYDETLAKRKEDLDIDNLKNESLKQQNLKQADINTLMSLEGKFAKDSVKEQNRKDALVDAELDKLELIRKKDEDIQNLRNKNAITNAQQKGEEQKKDFDRSSRLFAAEQDLQKAKLAGQEVDLHRRTELGLITSEQALKEKTLLDLEAQRINYENQVNGLRKEQLDLDVKMAVFAAQKKILGDDNPVIKKLGEQLTQEQNIIDKKKEGIKTDNDAKVSAINLAQDLGSTYTSVSKTIQGTFQGAADAIVEFVKTGKGSFKSLIDSMLADILRIQMRKQFESLFSAMAGTNLFQTAVSAVSGSPKPSAQGNIFTDTGLQKFAQGGLFTNSIVSSPTLFKFANGTGLMGEAGPEAIMPLKRDSNGTLGVRANNGGAKVDVVVNNYSNAQATTKETTDSRGNRKIEVVIGDIVAGEITRNGSSTQQAMLAGYGTKPAITRR